MIGLIPPQYKVLVMVGAIAALMIGEFFVVRSYYLTYHDNEILKINNANLEKVNEQIEIAHGIEQRLLAAKTELEKEHAKRKGETDAAYDRGVAWVRKHGLRDPGKRASCASNSVPGNPGTSNSSGGTDAGTLSPEASEFLLKLTREADKLRDDYQLCRDFGVKVKQLTKPSPSPSESQ